MREARLAVGFLFISLAGAVPARAQGSEPLAGLLLRFFSPDQPVVLRRQPEPRPEPRRPLRLAARGPGHPAARSTAASPRRSRPSRSAPPPPASPTRSTRASAPTTAPRSPSGRSSRSGRLPRARASSPSGVNYQNATWDSLDGRDLEGDDLNLYLVHQDTNRDGDHLALWFEGDIIRADLKVDAGDEDHGRVRELRGRRAVRPERGRALRGRLPGRRASRPRSSGSPPSRT